MLKKLVKDTLANWPVIPHVYQKRIAGQRPPSVGYYPEKLSAAIPGWIEAVTKVRANHPSYLPRRVLIFTYLSWWLEYSVALACLLVAHGAQVELAYLPYRRWTQDTSGFDDLRQSAILREVLGPLSSFIKLHDLSRMKHGKLSDALEEAMRLQSKIDVQYTMQREDIDFEASPEAEALFGLRLKRNRLAASAVQTLFNQQLFDSIIIPNGSILEFGAVFRAASESAVKSITFEFGEQRKHLWLAQDQEVMRLDTSDLWEVWGEKPLKPDQLQVLEELYRARKGARLWQQFSRQWQPTDRKGGRRLLGELDLDRDRPIILLCTNVVGDSLALDRQVFSEGMADWLTQTIHFFSHRPEYQLIIRIHPGELLGAGHPSIEIIHQALSDKANNVTAIPPDSEVNTYDLIDLADLGLVYTTTVGMEMVMSGVPVVVAGATHYRAKGFTYDPVTFEEYFQLIERILTDPTHRKVPQDLIEKAFRYAYRFFFQFPFPFPWHLVSFWEDIEARDMHAVCGDLGDSLYSDTLHAFAGHPIEWRERNPALAEVQA